jgi:hypothetical protein
MPHILYKSSIHKLKYNNFMKRQKYPSKTSVDSKNWITFFFLADEHDENLADRSPKTESDHCKWNKSIRKQETNNSSKRRSKEENDIIVSLNLLLCELQLLCRRIVFIVAIDRDRSFSIGNLSAFTLVFVPSTCKILSNREYSPS